MTPVVGVCYECGRSHSGRCWRHTATIIPSIIRVPVVVPMPAKAA